MGEGKTLVVLGAMAEGSTREDWFAKERFTEVKKGEPESAMEKKRERERVREGCSTNSVVWGIRGWSLKVGEEPLSTGGS